ncbi:hypothetical protein Hdeb2414_s0169g00821481 [Helianthus debilis subsp. tardiflorus]
MGILQDKINALLAMRTEYKNAQLGCSATNELANYWLMTSLDQKRRDLCRDLMNYNLKDTWKA